MRSTCAPEQHIPKVVFIPKHRALLVAAYFFHVRFHCFLHDVTVSPCLRRAEGERVDLVWPLLFVYSSLQSKPQHDSSKMWASSSYRLSLPSHVSVILGVGRIAWLTIGCEHCGQERCPRWFTTHDCHLISLYWKAEQPPAAVTEAWLADAVLLFASEFLGWFTLDV